MTTSEIAELERRMNCALEKYNDHFLLIATDLGELKEGMKTKVSKSELSMIMNESFEKIRKEVSEIKDKSTKAYEKFSWLVIGIVVTAVFGYLSGFVK